MCIMGERISRTFESKSELKNVKTVAHNLTLFRPGEGGGEFCPR